MSFKINTKKIATNTLALYIRMGITMLISFFTVRVTLQQLGVEDYGLNNLVGSIVSMFSFINGSMGTAVQRFYSIEIGRKNTDQMKHVFGTGLFLHILIAIITLIIAEMFSIFFLNRMNIPDNRKIAAQIVFQISIISLSLNIINVPYSALLRARELFSKTAMIEIIQSIFRLIVLFLLVHINYDKLIVYSLLNLFITLLYITSLFLLARQLCETHTYPLYDKELIRQMFSFVAMLLFTVFAQLLKTKGIVILVNLFFGLTVNAAYGVAVNVSHSINTFIMNFKQSMVPQMMAAYGAGDLSAMHKIINTGTKITYILLLMLSLPVIFECKYILTLWLKNPPVYSEYLVILVLIYININSFTYFQYQGVHATGKILEQQIYMSLLYFLNIFIIYIIFKLGMGFSGALYINMLISICQCIVNLFFSRKFYHYDLRQFLKKILFPCVMITGIIVCFLLLIIYIIKSSIYRFLLVLFLSEIFSVLFGFYFLFNLEEKNEILSFFKNKIINKISFFVNS